MPKLLLICIVSKKIGIGHLSRLTTLSKLLLKEKKAVPEILIFGDLINTIKLKNIKIHNFSLKDNLSKSLDLLMQKNNFKMLIFDIYSKFSEIKLKEYLKKLKKRNIKIIGIDCFIKFSDILDLVWIPSFRIDDEFKNCKNVKSGWNRYIIDKKLNIRKWQPGNKILILTGGSDALNLNLTLPTQLDRLLPSNIQINWVKGPFSNKPNLPMRQRLIWHVHDSPQYLDDLIVDSNYVMTIYGVSFFEVLQYGVPCVLFSNTSRNAHNDFQYLYNAEVSLVRTNTKSAIKSLIELVSNDKLATKLSKNALCKMSSPGTQNLTKDIYSILDLN